MTNRCANPQFGWTEDESDVTLTRPVRFRNTCWPYGPMLPILPGVILVIGLICTLITPYCRAASTVAIILGFFSVFLVWLPACIKFQDENQIRIIFIFVSVFSIVNLIMESICRVRKVYKRRPETKLTLTEPNYLLHTQNRNASYVAIAFWALGAIITAVFAFIPIKVVDTSANSTNTPVIEVTTSGGRS